MFKGAGKIQFSNIYQKDPKWNDYETIDVPRSLDTHSQFQTQNWSQLLESRSTAVIACQFHLLKTNYAEFLLWAVNSNVKVFCERVIIFAFEAKSLVRKINWIVAILLRQPQIYLSLKRNEWNNAKLLPRIFEACITRSVLCKRS